MNEKRRPTRGGAGRRVRQAIGLLLGPAVLLTIMVVPVHVFAGRLPTHSADMYRPRRRSRFAPPAGASRRARRGQGGPALALHTTDGWTRVVAMPEASEAAGVLSG